MSDKQRNSGQTPAEAATLRKQAEEQARNMEPSSPSTQTPEEIQQMLYELRVHQIELEMQNEELRRAQAEIEAGRARYFDLYDLAPVGYCTLSEQGLILEANLTAATLLGTNRGALVKQPISRFILKEDQDIYYLHRKKLFDTHSTGSGQAGEPQQCDLRLVKPDGALIWAHLTGTAAQAEDGAPVCRVMISDITERKRAEDAIKESKASLQTILGSTADGILATGKDESVRYANERFAEMWRIPKDVLESKDDSVLLLYVLDQLADPDGFIDKVKELYNSNEDSFDTIDFKDGRIFERLSRPLLDGREILGRIWSFRDITERKQAEEALRSSYSLIRIAGETAKFGGWSVDLQTNTCTWSDTVADIHGMPRGYSPRVEDGIGFYAPQWREKITRVFTDCAEKGTPYDEDMEIITNKGKRVWVRTAGEAVRDQSGKIVGVQGSFQDISDRKAWEREIGDLNSFLLSIRNLNQEIVKQDDFNELLKGSCRILTEIRGYIDVSIYYLDEDGRIRPQAHYGEHAHNPWTYDPVTESGAPECVMESLRSKKPVTIETCDERCAECEYCSQDIEHQVILVPMLDKDENVQGFIHACLEPSRELHKEEIALFEEVAGDLVFAHDKILADRKLKKSELDLRDRNHFINTILENLNLGVAVNSMDSGLAEYINPAFSRIYGWPPEDVKDVDRFFDVVYPDPEYRENLKRRVMEDIMSGDPERMRWDDARITTKSGEKRIVEARNIPLPEQNLMISTVWDVTERNTARQRLIESERKYRTLIETTSEGYWLVDNDGITIEVNDALCAMLGYKRDVLLGRRPTEFMDDTNRSIFETMISKKTELHQRTYGLQLLTAEGKCMDVIINATTILDTEGKIKGSFAMITDISDLKGANEALEREKKKSETLLDLISHDIGNIHQGMLSSLELLDAASLPEEVRRRNLLNIRNLANRSVHLVKNVLVLTRLESMDKNLNDIDVIGSIKRALDSCCSAFPDRTIHYRTISDPSPVLIKAEPILGEVFFNIFHNGIKVQKGPDPRLEAEVIPDPENFCVRIRISDWGPGIPDESKEKLLHRSRTPGEKVHSGIGLSLVRELVTRYNGRIRILDRVEGDPSSGACFELTFPSP